MSIAFNSKNFAYQEFSNMASTPFYVGGMRFFSNEGWFHYSKFVDRDTVWARKIMQEPDPFTARKMGRDRTHPIRRDWDYIKLDIMKIGLRAKFSYNQNAQNLLLNTKDEDLIEDNPFDLYWGFNCQTGQGQNMMGRCLMQVRSEMILS